MAVSASLNIQYYWYQHFVVLIVLCFCVFFFLQNHLSSTSRIYKQYKPGAVTVNLLPAIVGAGLVLLLLLPLFFLVVDPDLGTTSGLSTSGRPFLCLAPIWAYYYYSGSGYGGSQASGYGRVDERISAQGGPISTSSTGSSFGSYADLSEANFQSVSSFYDSEEVTSYGADSGESYEYELTSPLLAEVGSQLLIAVYNNKGLFINVVIPFGGYPDPPPSPLSSCHD